MMCRFAAAALFAILTITLACTKKPVSEQVIVQIPAGFNGNVLLDMGVRDAPPLPTQDGAYVIEVPRTGKVETSTLLNHAHVVFHNSSDGQVWGFSQRIFTTGDGISVGGKIEFFVGTQKDFDAEQQKKNKSGGFFGAETGITAG